MNVSHVVQEEDADHGPGGEASVPVLSSSPARRLCLHHPGWPPKSTICERCQVGAAEAHEETGPGDR